MIATNILLLIVVFLGVFVGALLAFVAPEELKPGKRHFNTLKIVLLALIIFSLFYFKANLIGSILVSLALVALFFVNKEYSLLSAVLALSFNSIQLLLAESILTFIYGLPTGTLLAERFVKRKKLELFKELLKNYVWFLVIGLVLLFVLPSA